METQKQNVGLVSVIVPVYNVENYLEKCIQSILIQTYDNLEIILIDDGSTDESPQICDRYSRLDERIVVIHKKNGGQSEARNIGIDKSTGDYIMFVDSDDYVSFYIVERLIDKMIENHADLSMCAMKFVDSNEKIVKNQQIFGDEVLSGLEILRDKMVMADWEKWGAPVAKLYKRAIIDKIRFPVGKKYEDQYIAHYIYGQCRYVSVLSEPMYCYLQRHGSTLHNDDIRIELYKNAAEAILDRTNYYISHEYLKNQAVFYLLVSIPCCHCAVCKSNKISKADYDKIQSLYRKEAKAVLKRCSDIKIKKKLFIILNFISLRFYLVLHSFKSRIK